MKNPTHEELQQYIDGTLDQQRNDEIGRMIHNDPQMAYEIDVYRSLNLVSKEVLTVQPSKNFTKNVMQSILPAQKESFFMHLINNSSNVFAMIMVLCTIVTVFIINSKHTGKELALPGSEQYQTIISSYGKFMDSFSMRSKEIFRPINPSIGNETKKILGIALIIFFGYIGLDQVLYKKIFPSKFRH